MAVVQSQWLSRAELLRPLVQHHQARPHGILAAIRYLLEALRVLVTSRAAPPGFVVLGVPVRLMGLSLSTGVATIAASFLQDVDSRSCDTPFGSVWDLLNIVFTGGACVVVVLVGVVLNRARRDVFVGLSRCIGAGQIIKSPLALVER